MPACASMPWWSLQACRPGSTGRRHQREPIAAPGQTPQRASSSPGSCEAWRRVTIVSAEVASSALRWSRMDRPTLGRPDRVPRPADRRRAVRPSDAGAARAAGPRGPGRRRPLRHALTQEVPADVLGFSVVHVNRTIQQLRRDGLLDVRNGMAVLMQREQLQELANWPPPAGLAALPCHGSAAPAPRRAELTSPSPVLAGPELRAGWCAPPSPPRASASPRFCWQPSCQRPPRHSPQHRPDYQGHPAFLQPSITGHHRIGSSLPEQQPLSTPAGNTPPRPPGPSVAVVSLSSEFWATLAHHPPERGKAMRHLFDQASIRGKIIAALALVPCCTAGLASTRQPPGFGSP